MKFKVLPAILFAFLLTFFTTLWTPPALALIPVQLENLGYKDCPPELAEGAVSSGSIQDAYCFIITGTAKNTTGKYIVDADVFGRIYDANNNPVMQNRGRLGSIAEVPPGETPFELRISIPSNLEPPLQLKQFKAAGFKNPIGR